MAIRGVREEMAVWKRFGTNLRREVRESGIINLRHLRDSGELSQPLSAAVFEGQQKPPPLVDLEKLAILLDIDRDVMFSWADRVAPDVISILARHPVLCKKIRKYGAIMLTRRERGLENKLLIGRKRRFPDAYFREKAPLPARILKYRK